MNVRVPPHPGLSLLTAYRGPQREMHLKVLLQWLGRIRETEGFTDFELIVAEGETAPRVEALVRQHDWAQYVHIEMSGLFHKSVLLNRAAGVARGSYLIPLDVDLLPARGTLQLHLALAQASPRCLIAGYRLQLSEALSAELQLPTAEALISAMSVEDASLLGPEDNPRALRKYLIDGQRFGVCPCYPKSSYDAAGGCNEEYIGRGPEDQDLIEEVCAIGLTLVRSYDLVYLHLPHGPVDGWDAPALLATNRERFAKRRRKRLELAGY